MNLGIPIILGIIVISILFFVNMSEIQLQKENQNSEFSTEINIVNETKSK